MPNLPEEGQAYSGDLIESLVDMVVRAERHAEPPIERLQRRVDAAYIKSLYGKGVSVNPGLPEGHQSGEGY